MGSQPSCKRVQAFDKANQVPSRSEPRPPKPFVPEPTPCELILREKPTQNDTFQFDPNVEEYSSVWDHDAKVNDNLPPMG